MTARPPLFPAARARALRRQLLAWYDREARPLPWRGKRVSAYRTLLSETMLQQTRVAVVLPRYQDFLRRWPSARAFAAASQEEILAAWSGLGYYARARNLHQAVREVVFQRGGRFPRTPHELRQLPGVGPYTANALAAIAFSQPVVAIDGNVRRVAARLLAHEGASTQIDAAIQSLAVNAPSPARHGDFAQAMMEIGALVCLPRRARCTLCPISRFCLSYKTGQTERFPRPTKRPTRVKRSGRAWILLHDGKVLLLVRRRQGLLAKMALPPLDGLDGASSRVGYKDAQDALIAILSARLTQAPRTRFVEAGIVRHEFTHISYTARVYRLDLKRDQSLPAWLSRPLAPLVQTGSALWVSQDSLHTIAAARLTSKLIQAATQ